MDTRDRIAEMAAYEAWQDDCDRRQRWRGVKLGLAVLGLLVLVVVLAVVP